MVIIVQVPKAAFPLWEKQQTNCRANLNMVMAEFKIELEQMKAWTRNLKRQSLNLNFWLKINEYADDMEFVYMNWGLKRSLQIFTELN